ncbi:MAG: transcription antitermination factor NusB, partial [Actinomycetota bacterium]
MTEPAPDPEPGDGAAAGSLVPDGLDADEIVSAEVVPEPRDEPLSERAQARERAMTLLYEAEAKGVPVAVIVADLPLEPLPFTLELTDGVEGNQPELDVLIERYSTGWRLDRMPVLEHADAERGAIEDRHAIQAPA